MRFELRWGFVVDLFLGGNVWVLTELAAEIFGVITKVGTDKIIESLDTTAKPPDVSKSNVILSLCFRIKKFEHLII